MAGFRRTLPLVLTVGAGCIGYQYIYRPKHRETLHIYDGVTVDQPWRVWRVQCHSFTVYSMLAVVDRIIWSPIHTSNNVKATLLIATSGAILLTEPNVASTKSNVASTLLPFFGNNVEGVFRTFDKVETNWKSNERATALYKVFGYLIFFLTFFHPYFFLVLSSLFIFFFTDLLPDLSTPSRINPFHFQARDRGGDQTWL